jgi:hypothetical protein
VTRDAILVSYDATGREIGRQPLFEPRDPNACYTDPAGDAVYGRADNDCRPAYHWR